MLKMTREELVARDPELAENYVPEKATHAYLDEEKGAVAYFIPQELTQYKPFGYVFENCEPSFDSEEEMLTRFIADIATL